MEVELSEFRGEAVENGKENAVELENGNARVGSPGAQSMSGLPERDEIIVREEFNQVVEAVMSREDYMAQQFWKFRTNCVRKT